LETASYKLLSVAKIKIASWILVIEMAGGENE
jgi:hypothetical protein